MLKFRDVLSRWERDELNELEAAELLGTSERSFRRWRRRFEEDGAAGLLDGRLGKASAKRVPVDEALRVEQLYRERYSGFTAKHFHEHLLRDITSAGATHGPRRSCSSAACCGGRRGAARIGAVGRGGRWWA